MLGTPAKPFRVRYSMLLPTCSATISGNVLKDAIIADETTSQGRLVLSVCIRLLDFVADQHKPQKREVLIDLCDLERSTGQAIAKAIEESLERHKINIADCKGQAYDTTASMSSDKKGVQAEICKLAPDADYQGCCLHGLNLVICHACKIPSIVNMMDACRELFSFFRQFTEATEVFRSHYPCSVSRLKQGQTEKHVL